MNWSPLNATPAVGFSQVSKVWRGTCGRRSSRTLLHRDPASGSGGMLLSQTGVLSNSAPRRSWSRRWPSARSSGPRSPASLAALAFFSCRVHSPRFRLYQWMA